jgi:hypothetical protein
METIATIENMQLSVQETVDELFSARMVPFKLTTYKINAEGFGEYVICFHDNSLHSVKFSWRGRGSVKDIVRAAVLDHIGKMSGPAVLEWLSPVAPRLSRRRSLPNERTSIMPCDVPSKWHIAVTCAAPCNHRMLLFRDLN